MTATRPVHTIALTRAVPPSIEQCELTHLARAPIDVALAVAQHERYEEALRALGCDVRRLPSEPDLPDSLFVEDIAVVVDECAVIARPGALSRRAETTSVAVALRDVRSLHPIEAPGTLDGGDVLRVGRRVFVGISTRTNESGARQLESILVPFEYSVIRVQTRGCLHLKSAASALGDEPLLLLDPACVDPDAFDGIEWMPVDASESFAANVLALGGSVLVPAAAPRTQALLRARGLDVIAIDVSELAKAEAGLTCCSIIFDMRP